MRNAFVAIDVIRFIIRIHKKREFSIRKWLKIDFEKYCKVESEDFYCMSVWLINNMRNNFVFTGSTALMIRGIISGKMGDVDITVKTYNDYFFLKENFPYVIEYLDVEVNDIEYELIKYKCLQLPCAKVKLIKRRYIISSIKGLFYSLSYVKKYIKRLEQIEAAYTS